MLQTISSQEMLFINGGDEPAEFKVGVGLGCSVGAGAGCGITVNVGVEKTFKLETPEHLKNDGPHVPTNRDKRLEIEEWVRRGGRI